MALKIPEAGPSYTGAAHRALWRTGYEEFCRGVYRTLTAFPTRGDYSAWRSGWLHAQGATLEAARQAGDQDAVDALRDAAIKTSIYK